MKLLLLGGTRFLGRHVVDAALDRGFEVTLFTRGQMPNHWGTEVRALTGNRDPAIAPGLAELADGRWDSVIDTCGYVPRIVRASAQLLAPRVGRYLFVSSTSVFTNASCPGLDESAPVGVLADPASEEVGEHYGPLKAACETVVSEVYGARALNIRPGLIVGPHDPTDRFGYWVARFVHPRLLGVRGADAVVPAPPSRPIQLIDARDLASFMLDLVANGASGTFNATSPARQWSFADLVAALAAAGGAKAPRPVWIDEATLVEHKVTPWSGLPLWIPSSFAEEAGFMEIDCTKAHGKGLRTRALATTIADTAAWLTQRINTHIWNDVLTSEAERAILAVTPESHQKNGELEQ